MKRPPRGFTLRNARAFTGGGFVPRDVAVEGGRVASPGGVEGLPELDLDGALLLPALVNGHDHLDLAAFPPLGRPPFPNAYEWGRQVEAAAGDPDVRSALAVPLPDRLFLGGLRNLLAGVASVAHHGGYHRSFARPGFPVRVQSRYGFAVSPGLTPRLRATYRTTDRRIPWFVHVAEGTDERSRGELMELVQANVLRQNTVMIHGIALPLDEVGRIAQARAALVWCPESNRRLYGATAAVAALLAGGVRVGLGSDSAAAGPRDALSNLASALREGVLEPEALLELATRGTAEVVRLAPGGFEEGSPADFLVADSLPALLGGDRRAIGLVVIGGTPCYGRREFLERLGVTFIAWGVDGEDRALESERGQRAGALLRAHPGLKGVPWIAGLAP